MLFRSVTIICPVHGEFVQRAGAHIKGHGCNICKESKGEIRIAKYLAENKIPSSREKVFDGCKNERFLPFDFYLYDKNLIIEFDGRQHFEPVQRFGGEEGLEKTKINDNIKNQYCIDNDIKLIRVSYRECIEKVLDSYFSLNE